MVPFEKRKLSQVEFTIMGEAIRYERLELQKKDNV